MKRRTFPYLLAGLCGALALLPTLAAAGSKKQPDPVAELRAAVAREVADAERAGRMTAAIDEMEGLLGEAGSFAARVKAELLPMLKDRAASREAIEAKLAELNVVRAVLAERAFSAHLALKAAATPEEWKKLRKVEERTLGEALGRSLQGDAPSEKEG